MKKKLITILLLCSLCLTICACNINAPNEVNQNDSTETPTNNLPNETVERPEGDDHPILTLESGDAYTKFLNSVEMPADFVSYDKIDAIGAFNCLVFLSDAYANDYSCYLYSLVDSEGFEINLYVDHRDEVLSTANSVSKVNKTNMRLLSDTSSGVYVSDNIKYQYVSGELLSISWETQNVNYTLCGSMFLSDYPLTSSTLVGKMLNSNTAQQAIRLISKES